MGKKCNFYTAVLLLTLASWPVQGARILAVEPFPAKSHMVVFSSLTRELARRGHELVVVSAFPQSKPIANYTDIDFSKEINSLKGALLGEQMYDMANFKVWQMALMMWGMGLKTSEDVLNIPKVKDILKDERGFDLVIVESFMNEAVYGFADHFKAPLVLVSPFGGFNWFNYYHGNPAPLSYVPNAILPFTDRMSFTERLTNTFVTLMWDLGQQLYYMPRQDAIRKKIFGESSKSVWELERSVSLSLLNNHVSLSYPRPLMPNMVEVGGMHVLRTTNKLPDDIQKFLDGAKDGVVYFSMGSNLRSDQMPAHKRDALMAAFAELPQRVLWKWESETLPGKPDNVKLGKWLPQQDILAHPKVRLFITHGGLLSAQEAIFHGVPLVGIPVFGDQSLNMKKAELGGYGLTVELKNVTKESILWAANTVLNNPSYRREARLRSGVNRDQPESPLERAVFWTEYVLRHGGASHLRSAAVELPWYQLYLLDVAAAVFATIVLFLLVVKKLLCMCCGSSKSKKTDNKKQKVKKS